jgi:hypothetical protein
MLEYYDIAGQLAGTFPAYQELLSSLKEIKYKQIGFEVRDNDKDNIVLVINKIPVKIGSTDRIEYKDIQITSCYLETEASLIITYLYEKEIS